MGWDHLRYFSEMDPGPHVEGQDMSVPEIHPCLLNKMDTHS